MPELIIDQRKIVVPEGTKVIAAAEQLGIMIPRFCYHPALGSLGACRMCAVLFKEGPVKGLEMSCMVDVQDGMVVSTTDPEAVAFRKWIVECLMLNHPHDCPVCDEGGHCLLQDETVSGGHGLRRYRGKKRTYTDQNLGPFIQHEMNRCIHCWRCRRFYQEYAGYHDLGAFGIGNRTYFGRSEEGALSSPFSGNLVDICPTGVFTDKPSRFKGRRWDFERAPTLCLNCSLGCNMVASTRYRELVRMEARLNSRVNGYFICDRGRYGFQYANHPERPRRPTVDGAAAAWEEALHAASERLQAIREKNGRQAVACLGSVRTSLESQARLALLCRNQGWPEPLFFSDPSLSRKTRTAVSRLDSTLAVSMKDMEDADLILVVGSDPINEAPMLALALRQAQRRGAVLAVLDPRPVSLPAAFQHVPIRPSRLRSALCALITNAVPHDAAKLADPGRLQYHQRCARVAAEDREIMEQLAALPVQLRKSRRPVIVCGTDVVPETIPSLAADLALLLKQVKDDAGLFYVLNGANAFGAALLSPPDEPSGTMIENIENGNTRALLLVETDPFNRFPDQRRLRDALARLELLITVDYLPSPALSMAHIVLPACTAFETKAHYANQEGRIQTAWPAYEGGTPLSQVSGGTHPPRSFGDDLPGGESRNACRVLADLDAKLSGREENRHPVDLWNRLEERGVSVPRDFPWDENPEVSARVSVRTPEQPFSPGTLSATHDSVTDGAFSLLLVEWTFGTEELSSCSPAARQAENPPFLTMHAEDAAALGLASGDMVLLHLDDTRLKLGVQVAEKTAKGILILPRHRQLDWQGISRIPAMLFKKHIERTEA